MNGYGPSILVNRAGQSSSPYVRSHANNPVAWQQWDSTAISLAKEHNRLIFLSIGYSACHWCHVMEHESFESLEVASILNSSFIPIKVDREARHDIDEIYMHYVTATTGTGGWPLNVFLTPNLEPVFGGTYWPGPHISSQPGRAIRGEEPLNFLDILEKMREVWQTQRQRCLTSAKEITQQLKQFAEEGTHSQAARVNEDVSEPLELELLEDAFDHFETRYDPTDGGFSSSSSAPKFPTPPNLIFLLRLGGHTASPFTFPRPVRSILGPGPVSKALKMSSHTLLRMSRGGVRDHLGYGFARYSVTPDWNLPHFEKLLPDNAQLLSAYSIAFASTHDPEHLSAMYSLISYLTSSDSRLVSRLGALYSSENADSPASNSSSEKREGAYYLFTHKEIHTILADLSLPTPKPETQYPQVPANAADILCRHFNILPDGNIPSALDPHDSFLTANVLSIAATPSVLSKEFGLPESSIVQILKAARAALAAHRASTRIPPDVDRKIVTEYNALAITGLLDAAIALRSIDTARSSACLTAATKIADFIQSHLYVPSTRTLYRVYTIPQEGSGGFDPSIPAFAPDYAYLIRSLLTLYSLTANGKYLLWAVDLQSTFDRFYATPDATEHAGYHTSPSFSPSNDDDGRSGSDVEPILRLKPGTDTSLPSPNGVATSNLLILANLLPDDDPSASSSTTGTCNEYLHRANLTLSAFAVEVIQHPFLFPTLLDAAVAKEVGIESVVVNKDDDAEKAQKLEEEEEEEEAGPVGLALELAPGLRLAKWGRTILFKGEGYAERWVGARNRVVGEWRPRPRPRGGGGAAADADIKVDGDGNGGGEKGKRERDEGKGGGKGKALWCLRGKVCREVGVGEIEEGDRRGGGGG